MLRVRDGVRGRVRVGVRVTVDALAFTEHLSFFQSAISFC